MLARIVLGVVTAAATFAPALAGSMNADEARRFVAGKVFAFTCFDGTRGAGRILEDLGAAGAVQFSGAGPVKHLRLPGNTLQIRGQNVCASIKGIPFEPCFNLEKTDDRSFRGSVSGMGFAYCDFHHQGGNQMLMARAAARPRSLHRAEHTGSVGPANTEVAARVETPRVESSRLEPVKSEPTSNEGPLELRRSTQ
ncbi:hypothetical protein [Bradyrhizobium symbiodeficiens]|uniref:Uncharacterized protein n=1 Tax=Bradyrhizobium symbiodeficiens TaxID=1404367 RepID=A0A2U8Q856_9BRAD|nr:hypothetical protein [Bradyrhizobium symbiodeficiens]AWM06049.1 hypothetical protein CIT39_06010 [Bradyrhizobium symbiodeficiens]QDF36429.1 hypothetical protein FJN17_02000 [Bradyrhizobium symbiodeficiens]QIO99082.1 hypothetical protein HAU86_04380 [Bradyrhizobium symbiodeficiens]QIP05318.1 hypothetical protein HAV00_03205 [Bradyrhizobium symbiodeficiens]